jgi:hypothetical protein
MAINKNHLFNDLDGVKCSIVEQKVPEARMKFLKDLLEYNGYTVVVVAVPAPKPKPDPDHPEDAPPPPAPPDTYTLGVTDLTFNPTNAVFGRQLHTPKGHVVTLAFWEQQEDVSHDEIPYYARKG